MLICGIDLSSSEGSVALLDTERRLGKEAAFRFGRAVNGKRRDASTLMLPALDRLLLTWNRRVSDIEVFMTTTGPGSFTGLRVALASVEGITFGRKKAAAGIGTLFTAAWAQTERRNRTRFLSPVFRAGRGEVYAALYEAEGENIVEKSSVRACAPSAWKTVLQDQKGSIEIFGSGAGEFLSSENPSWKIRRSPMRLALPAARYAAHLLREGGGRSLPPPVLAYVRAPDVRMPSCIPSRPFL